jgi:hypothetical protein
MLLADADTLSASSFLSLQYHKKEILSWYYCFWLHLILKAGGGQVSLRILCQIYSIYIKSKAPQEPSF